MTTSAPVTLMTRLFVVGAVGVGCSYPDDSVARIGDVSVVPA